MPFTLECVQWVSFRTGFDWSNNFVSYFWLDWYLISCHTGLPVIYPSLYGLTHYIWNYNISYNIIIFNEVVSDQTVIGQVTPYQVVSCTTWLLLFLILDIASLDHIIFISDVKFHVINHKGNWLGTFFETFWMNKEKFTRAGFATSGLTCWHSTNWAN